MSSTSVGRDAESWVASELTTQGYVLREQNWRTKWCEIDLIMTKKSTAYFIEVKFRSSSDWGSGMDYITPKKLRQMGFAAEMWMSEHAWQNDAELCVVEVAPDTKQVELISAT